MVTKSNIEADFLPSFELHHPAVVDHQLNGSVANGSQGLQQLVKERRRQGEWVAGDYVSPRRDSRLGAHDPIYPI